MGKHRHKKSFYDVDEDELQSSRKHHHHHHRRHHHSNDKSEEIKQRVPSISSFHNSKLDDDEAALQSPPSKRQRSSSNSSQSPSKLLSQLIENPEFLASAGPKAKEFAETARQLLAKPDLDATTQQIICAMAQVRFLLQTTLILLFPYHIEFFQTALTIIFFSRQQSMSASD